jgi:hypothetical protein
MLKEGVSLLLSCFLTISPFFNSEMNELVLNYLLVEGYKSAADCFVADSGIETQRKEN